MTIDETIRAATEEIAKAIRSNCPACDNGVMGVSPDGSPDECGYCGRLLRGIAWESPSNEPSILAAILTRHFAGIGEEHWRRAIEYATLMAGQKLPSEVEDDHADYEGAWHCAVRGARAVFRPLPAPPAHTKGTTDGT